MLQRKFEGAWGDKMFDRIAFDPKIMGGKACIRGMRIPVSLVVNLVANGMSQANILSEYPDLKPDDIRQSLRYVASEQTIKLPPE